MNMTPEEYKALTKARKGGKRVNKLPAKPIVPGTETTVEVSIPPSTNNLFATYKGRRIISREYAAWKEKNLPILARLAPATVYPVHVWLTLTGKVHMSRDISNIEKALGDGLVSVGVIANDSMKYVWGAHQVYEPGEGEPVVRVEIRTP